MLIIDSGGVSRLAERSPRALALIRALRDDGLWPPVAPTVVLVESLQGHSGRDATTNGFLKTCVIDAAVTETTARRAAELRRRARDKDRQSTRLSSPSLNPAGPCSPATRQTSLPSPPTPTR